MDLETIAMGAQLAKNIMGMFENTEAKARRNAREMMDYQAGINEDLMNKSFGHQKSMYDYTYQKESPEQQRKLLEKAGLNPALMYGMSGAVGTSGSMGSGGANVSMGNVSTESDIRNAKTNEMANALALVRMKSEIEVNKSIADKNQADAENARSNTTTENQIRDYAVEMKKQEAINQWIINNRNKYLDSNQADNMDNKGQISYNAKLDEEHAIDKGSYFDQQISTEIAQAMANAGNQNAQAALTNEKTKGYWQELLNETIKAQAAGKTADAAEVIAAAQKLAAEFNTGEFTNWKTWVQTSLDAAKAFGSLK